MTKPAFMEPTTGRLVDPQGPDCPYTGVELVWNASNAWICMQVAEQACQLSCQWQQAQGVAADKHA